MTILEKKSERKKKAIMQLVQSGEYSLPYAMMEAEELNDNGKLLDNDYEELAEYLENLLNPVVEEVEETEVVEEIEPAEAEDEDIGENIPNEENEVM